MADANTATIDATFTEHASTKTEERHRHGCGARAKKKWSVAELGTMVGGFVLFWPVGLVALGAKLMKGEMWPGSSENVAPWKASWKKPEGFFGDAFKSQWRAHSWTSGTSTGNAAFDAYKRSKLEELEAARKKLEDEQKAFAEYLTKLREAKDRDEFDRFMAEKNGPQSAM
jgi:hypothetical protein